ncbi:MAG: DUF2779 domain-containing protein [Burkholderiaceae bacterium]
MTPRYLTKSRFKLAVQCPTKLYFVGKPEYQDNSIGDSFLAALAEGGFQVGELARLMYPEGHLVEDADHEAAVARTKALLLQENVTIFEAALQAQNYFVRVDILRKQCQRIDLIEVKAKSWDGANGTPLIGKKGAINKALLPYLQDVAFQWFVAGLALEGCELHASLMLADRATVATTDGLNQRFKVSDQQGRATVHLAAGTTLESVGAPVLTAVPVDDLVRKIVSETLDVSGAPINFDAATTEFSDAYRTDRRITPKPGVQCADCQFMAPSPPGQAGDPRSGFHECWQGTYGLTNDDLERGTVLDLWNHRGKQALIDRGVRRLLDVEPSDLGLTPELAMDVSMSGMTASQRQWFQASGQWPGAGPFFLNREGLREAMALWTYPLHFIDFETCAVALPFRRGQRPYETVAFQFSHHMLHEDGRVAHRSQFLEATPGTDPTVPFLQSLRDALIGDTGTVFRWATHENTVLNQLRLRLQTDAETPAARRTELVAFIESITQRDDGGTKHVGRRNMVDLAKLAERHFFHPDTAGSSSLKKVLPAVMRSSDLLRELYSLPRYGTSDMPSLNLTEPTAWWVSHGGVVCDPYALLPPVFTCLSAEDQAALDAGLAPELAEGGAAMAAYAQLQFQSLETQERHAIETALKRYCELDTLAMVMVVQAWCEWLRAR